MRALPILLALLLAATSLADDFTVHKRLRVEQPSGTFAVQEKTETWSPRETAVIVCDMWDAHHCLNAVRRETEMAPRLNEVLKVARQRGALIIHAPSSCMDPYQNHPGRKLAQSAPTAKNVPIAIDQ